MMATIMHETLFTVVRCAALLQSCYSICLIFNLCCCPVRASAAVAGWLDCNRGALSVCACVRMKWGAFLISHWEHKWMDYNGGIVLFVDSLRFVWCALCIRT